MIATHADWSTDPRKRWMTVARLGAGGWRAEAPRPVGDPHVMLADLLADGAPVALGLDVPLGIPRDYAALAGIAEFPTFLRGLVDRPGFFAVSAALGTVGLGCPFYPARGVRGMTRASHAEALGLDSPAALSRWCDRATTERPAGAPVFWTLGANQSGKAAIAAWRDWLAPALVAGVPIRLWPFEGGLHGLLTPGVAVLAEVYPAEALRHCGLRMGGSKRSQLDRAALAEPLLAVMAARRVASDRALVAAVRDGFGRDARGEDRFDSLIGLLGLIGVLDGLRPDFVPDDPAIRSVEGWVLGQSALPRTSEAVALPRAG